MRNENINISGCETKRKPQNHQKAEEKPSFMTKFHFIISTIVSVAEEIFDLASFFSELFVALMSKYVAPTNKKWIGRRPAGNLTF